MTGERIRGGVERVFPLLLGLCALLAPLTRAVQDTGFVVCLVLFAVHRAAGPKGPPAARVLNRYYLIIAVYLLVAMLSMAYSADPAEGARQFKQLGLLVLCMFFAELCPRSAARWALRLFAVGTSGLSCLTLYQGFWRHVERPPTIMHPVHGGIVLLFGIAVVLALLTGMRDRRAVPLALVVLALHVGALYLNGTRAAWVGVVAVVFAVPFLVPGMTVRRKAAYLAVVLVAVAAIGNGAYVREKMRQAQSDLAYYRTGQAETSLGGRFEMWKASWRMYREHPVLGVGIGGWQETLKRMVRRGDAPEFITQYNQTHNVYLDALSTRGVPGLLSLLSLLVYPVAVALRDREPHAVVFCSALVLLGVAALVTGCADTLVRLRLPFMSYIVVTAAALAGLAGRNGVPASGSRENDSLTSTTGS